MAKGVSPLGLGHLLCSSQSSDSLPQFSRPVHLYSQDLGRGEQEFMEPYACSSTFSLLLFPVSLEFGTGSVLQTVHRRCLCPPRGAEFLNGHKFCIALWAAGEAADGWESVKVKKNFESATVTAPGVVHSFSVPPVHIKQGTCPWNGRQWQLCKTVTEPLECPQPGSPRGQAWQ